MTYGARMAEPGEFTKRAFLNGRINLKLKQLWTLFARRQIELLKLR
ncbi:hypothetical protein ACVNPZ_03205 [Staphylococcus aureus]